MILSVRYIRAILLGAMTTTCAVAFAQSHMPSDNPYDELLSVARVASDLPPAEQVKKVEASYWALFPAGDLHKKSVAELDEMLRATLVASGYTHLSTIGARGPEILKALEADQAATPQRIVATFDALLASSQVDAAAELAGEYPNAKLAQLPDRRTAASFVPNAPAEWGIGPDAATMTRKAVPFGAGLEIIVVAHPLCHFSQNAVAAISHDAGLAETFANHARWITPPLQEGDFEVIPEWNREHPKFAMTSVYDPNRWQGFDFRETPVFYFLVDGRIRQVVRGWPGDAQLASLKQAIAALAPPAPQAQAAASTRK